MSIENPTAKTAEAIKIEAEKDQLALTLEGLNKLQDYKDRLIAHLQTLEEYLPKAENGKRMVIKVSETRSIGLDRDRGSSFYLRDIVRNKEGKENRLSFEVNPDAKYARDNRDGVLVLSDQTSMTTRTTLNYNGLSRAYGLEEIYGQETKGLDEKGVHVKSQEQETWDRAWDTFQHKLLENKKFLESVDQSSYDKKLSQEQRNWFNKLMRASLDVPDMEAFLREIGSCWKMATGKDLPAKDIPKFENSKRPEDAIISHEDVRKMIDYITRRLMDTVRHLDEKAIPAPPNPFRAPGHNISPL
jgi:hypothetical protein